MPVRSWVRVALEPVLLDADGSGGEGVGGATGGGV